MTENTKLVCEKCGTPLVPVKAKYNGSMKYDGTSTYGSQMICPNCHPELVKEKD